MQSLIKLQCICNNNANSWYCWFLVIWSSNPRHKSAVHSTYSVFIFLANSTVQLTYYAVFWYLLNNHTAQPSHCFIIFLKFPKPLFITTLGCRMIIIFSTAIIVKTHIIFSFGMFIVSAFCPHKYRYIFIGHPNF